MPVKTLTQNTPSFSPLSQRPYEALQGQYRDFIETILHSKPAHIPYHRAGSLIAPTVQVCSAHNNSIVIIQPVHRMCCNLLLFPISISSPTRLIWAMHYCSNQSRNNKCLRATAYRCMYRSIFYCSPCCDRPPGHNG